MNGVNGQGSRQPGQGGPLHSLIELLHQQVKNYSQALSLEKELERLASAEDYKSIEKNTLAKSELMEKIKEIADQIAPLLAEHKDKAGKLPDKEGEQLRLQALDLLQQITEAESRNRNLLLNKRERMLNVFRDAKHAKKTARGYKQSKSDFGSRFDTKS